MLLCLSASLSLFSCSAKSQDAPPTFAYLYNTGEGHRAIGEYLQSALSVAGLSVSLMNQEWGTFLNTRRLGEYTLARNGWLADYSDPISFLDMWTSNSGSNDIGFGKGEHKNISIYTLDLRELGYDINIENGTWANTYDRLIGIIKSERDTERRFALMHKAEDMLMDTGCITPIYYYTDIYMLKSSVSGFFSSPTGTKYFLGCDNGGRSNMSVCLASEPESLDPAHNTTTDGSSLISHLFSGLAAWRDDGEGGAYIAADCAEELPEGTLNDDGTVSYIYTLREGLLWSDGVPLVASDFEYAWKRAADPRTGAEYGYMLDVLYGYGGDNPDELGVKALDERHLEVTLASPVSYFNELLTHSVYMPVRSDIVTSESWAADARTYIGNGPFVMDAWEHNSYISLSRNELYHDKERVKMKNLKFYLSDDANNALTGFKNGTLQLIDNIPTNEIPALQKNYPSEFFVKGQIGTYYICWNINRRILPRGSTLSGNEAAIAEGRIRRAISRLIDRNYICESIGQAGQVPASSFVALGIKEPSGEEFCRIAGGNTEYYGYFDTSREAFPAGVAEAMRVLSEYYSLK